jgi:Leucine-rich repeat (LRR) protein
MFAMVLTNFITPNKTLSKLDVRNNDLARKLLPGRRGDKDHDWEADTSGVAVLLPALQNLVNLKHLSVAANGLDNHAAALLAESVCLLPALVTIDFSCNAIGGVEGANAIQKVLLECK